MAGDDVTDPDDDDDDEDEVESVSQIGLVGAICTYLANTHAALNKRQINAIIAGANMVMDALKQPHIPVEYDMGLLRWLRCDETGMSSKWMARCLSDRIGHGAVEMSAEQAFPHDAADFGRCVGLLTACPAMRGEMGVMADQGPEWKALVENWGDLEAMWLKSVADGSETIIDVSALNAKIRKLVGEDV